jgi:hypothetical protein
MTYWIILVENWRLNMRAYEFIDEVWDRNDPRLNYFLLKYSIQDPHPNDPLFRYTGGKQYIEKLLSLHDQLEFYSEQFFNPPSEIMDDDEKEKLLDKLHFYKFEASKYFSDSKLPNIICDILIKYLNS